MPGNSPDEAVAYFLEQIKTALSVLTAPHLVRPPGALGVVQAATLRDGPVRIGSDFPKYAGFQIDVKLQYAVIEDPSPQGHYRCTSHQYIYTLYDDQQRKILAFHWHPGSNSPEEWPHCHVGEAFIPQRDRLHIPTERLTVEQFVRIAVESFGARATSDDYAEVLDITQQAHEEHRSWASRFTRRRG